MDFDDYPAGLVIIACIVTAALVYGLVLFVDKWVI